MKVQCIKAVAPLISGAVYTVRFASDRAFYLEEVDPPPEYSGFHKWRFRPLEEKGDTFISDYIQIDEHILSFPLNQEI